jgi:HAE1 family hydrophobic/amphiphilic exporter-1
MSEPTRSFAISAWSIRNPIPVAVLFIGLVLAGLIAYGRLPVKMYPNIQFPLIAVTVTQAGAAQSRTPSPGSRGSRASSRW